MQPGGTGGDDRKVGPFEAEAYRYMTRDHVDDGGRHKERRNAAGATVRELGVRLFDHRQATDPGANDASDPGGFFLPQRIARGKTGISNRLRSSSDTEMNERIHRARFFRRHVRLDTEALDLACDLAGKAGRVKLGDAVDAGLAGKNVGPGLRHRVTHGADATQAGHDNATTTH